MTRSATAGFYNAAWLLRLFRGWDWSISEGYDVFLNTNYAYAYDAKQVSQ